MQWEIKINFNSCILSKVLETDSHETMSKKGKFIISKVRDDKISLISSLQLRNFVFSPKVPVTGLWSLS